MNKFSKINKILNDAKNGKMFILVDDEQRENEGDLIIPAVKINANLHYPDTGKQIVHTDFKFKNLLTSIYYINTNDGGTKIKNKVVQSIENRMVIFPCNTPHAVVRHTDSSIGRFVINFN